MKDQECNFCLESNGYTIKCDYKTKSNNKTQGITCNKRYHPYCAGF